jgi:hypothetical protein
MKRAKQVNREETLKKITENCNHLLKSKNFLSSNDWETDTLLIQAENFLNRHKLIQDSKKKS